MGEAKRGRAILKWNINERSTGAAILAERLRKEIESIPFFCSEEKVHITASFGLVSIDNWDEQEDLSYEAFLYNI